MADKKPPPIPPSEGPRDNQEITSFTASPSSITAGQSTTLSWVIVGSWSLHVSGSGDPAFETGTHSGSTTVSPTTTTTYQINVFHGSDLITAQVTVTVTAVVPTTASFSVSPSSISSGGYVTVYWSVSNSPDAPNVAGTGFSSPYEPVSNSGSRTVGPIYFDQSWTLSYNNEDGNLRQIYRSVSVTTPIVYTNYSDYVYRRASSTPSTPSGGTSTENHQPSGWSSSQLTATSTLNVYRSRRVEYYEDNYFSYASSWQTPTLWRESLSPTIAIGSNEYNVSIGSSEIVAISIGDTDIS